MSGCQESSNTDRLVDNYDSIQFFQEVSTAQSGLDFSNTLYEDQKMNFMTEQGMFNGGGIGILDINNDGLQDVFFAANMGKDKLYLNKGDFKFEDISEKSGIIHNSWSTGVAIVDINNDGYDDIYVCKYLGDQPSDRANLFYINNKNNTFTESANQIGLGDSGFSIMANFFDYDRDGDLDVFIANQPPNSRAHYAQYKGINDFKYTDRLYKNTNGKFTDVTIESGIKNYGYALSATTLDYNKDGWPDLYVACDFDEPDFFYKNNGNGTFTNVTDAAFKHISNFSMGADVADINNDGELDLYVVDMVAEDNFRQKTNMSGMNPERFHKLADAGFHYQYMQNVLQLNNADNTFSDIAHLSGLSNTDWSWSPLFIDIDQDGFKDIIVTNGIFRDIRNKDFEKWRVKWFEDFYKAQETNTAHLFNPMDVINKAPSIKLANYIFKNNGDLSFTKKSADWGLDKKTWSQGSAFADFDNDGDLDLIVNNTNTEASLYKNVANDNKVNNYINIELEGDKLNKNGINAMITVESGIGIQAYEYTPYRGYLSCSQRLAHFGLGNNNTIDKITVTWANNKMNVIENVSANQKLVIKQSEATSTIKRGSQKQNTLFNPVNDNNFLHVENTYDDYKKEILLPYKTSTLGPVLTTGDVNGDGLTDIFFGASVNQSSKILINQGDGSYSTTTFPAKDKKYEDGGALFVDIDNDNDLDLYVTSGGNEYKIGSQNYQDRLYLNDGSGQYTKSKNLPTLNGSNGSVASIDYDSDGDQDIIVTGRLVPANYGKTPQSYLLENKDGKFKDVTASKAPEFNDLGMITDIAIADLNGDDISEIIFTGEWMPIKIFEVGSTIKDVSTNYNLDKTSGWWNCVEVGDIDDDGDLDLIAGNLGTNTKYKASINAPFKLYVDDFDKNGTNDVYLGYFQDGKCYPVRGRQCSSEQMPFVSEDFKSYQDFGDATITEVLADRIGDNTTVRSAESFSSTAFINDNGKFSSIPLPNQAQIFPVNDVVIADFDKDGHTDVFVAGNMYQREVETTRSDSGKGCMMTFDKEQNIKIISSQQTGISADKDVRDIAIIQNGQDKHLVIANNNDAIQFYKY